MLSMAVWLASYTEGLWRTQDSDTLGHRAFHRLPREKWFAKRLKTFGAPNRVVKAEAPAAWAREESIIIRGLAKLSVTHQDDYVRGLFS